MADLSQQGIITKERDSEVDVAAVDPKSRAKRLSSTSSRDSGIAISNK